MQLGSFRHAGKCQKRNTCSPEEDLKGKP